MTFDVGNQKTLANISALGQIAHLCFYRENHYTEEKPGVWVNKGLAQTEQINFALTIDGQTRQLCQADHNIIVDTLADAIPRVQHRYLDVEVTEIPFCPISGDERKSMLVVPLYIKNITAKPIRVAPCPPRLFQQKYSDQQNVLAKLSGGAKVIAPNATACCSYVFVDPDCYDELDWLTEDNCDRQLIATVSYHQRLFSGLQQGENGISTSLKRAAYQALLSLAMNKDGQIVGANWGSYPAVARIWNKDMFYVSLPIMMLDAHLAKQIILWFSKYHIKPKGTKFQGGIYHSLGNTLAPVMLAGMYYQWFGDVQFFKDQPQLVADYAQLLQTIRNDTHQPHPVLRGSEWVSDAYALGDVHTGSNICLWSACVGLAEIYQALGQSTQAGAMNRYAQEIHEAIDSFLVVKDKSGQHWLEGRNVDGNYLSVSTRGYEQSIHDQGLIFLSYMIKNHHLSLVMHDGEESDTTMAPVYGFESKDSPVYQHTMQFAGSNLNPTFVEGLQGISWGEESGTTFPGFITLLMGHASDAQDFEQQYKYLLALADLDGSWWWWPYGLQAKYGDVLRNFGPGKCGWASGMAVSLLLTQYYGVSVQHGALAVAPMKNLTSFCWEQARIGRWFVTLKVTPTTITIHNLADQAIEVWVNQVKHPLIANETKQFERAKQ
ncbi:glycoside hydrolase family 125 protein [Lacticaseibacillus daqingensis]|uniref:glycoside hydrolase n=1 Tax=Lacticaseibacillus daqingensis TaxID=2486014 RepID=UPI000F780411|nr:glycoside hydrolase [Lacticaseibacillus daqingensis]